MKIILIILGYLRWHYSKAVFSLSKIWINFLFFILNYFSIKLLFLNFFSPWKRMADSYPKAFDLKKYFFVFIANIITRIVGMILRTILIIVGLFCFTAFILLYPLIIIIWLALPLIVIFLICLGLTLIIF